MNYHSTFHQKYLMTVKMHQICIRSGTALDPARGVHNSLQTS